MNQLKEPITNPADIAELLPHRWPVVLVDKMVYYDNEKIKSGFTIPDQHLFVMEGMLSESGLLEHMAQSTALFMGYRANRQEGKPREGYIAAIREASIQKLPKVSENLETEIIIIHEIMDMLLVKGISRINGEVIATVEMSTILKPVSE